MAGRFVKILNFFKDGPDGLSFLFKTGLLSDESSLGFLFRKEMGTPMIKAKVGGIVLGGLAGYLILSKGINMIERCVKHVCTAKEWKNYYKFGKEGNMVPPGYSMTTGKDGTEAGEDGSVSPKNSNIGESIGQMISDAFNGYKAAKEASEGQEKASDEDICPENCSDCKVEKCPYANLKNDGEITEWNEKHEPVAGRYSWNKEEDLHWEVIRKEPIEEEEDSPLDKALKFLDYVDNCKDKGMSDAEIAMSLGMDIVSFHTHEKEMEGLLAKRDQEEDTAIDMADEIQMPPEEETNDETLDD